MSAESRCSYLPGPRWHLEPVSKGGVCMSKHFVSTMSGRFFPAFAVLRKGRLMRKAGGMIGVIAGILGFIAAVAPLFTNGMASAFDVPVKPQVDAPPLSSQVQSSPATAGLGIIGRWSGRLEGDGIMEIDPAPTGFKVSLRVSGPSGCVGSIEGSGPISGDTITLTKEKDGQVCTIAIKFAGETAAISENNCSDYHGAACGFHGTLKRED